MKVNLYKTVQVSDEQRVQIANVIDGAVSRRKATRDELKEFIWDQGELWDETLADKFAILSGDDAPAEEEPEDDTVSLEDLL